MNIFIVRRYLLFIAALFVNAFGIAFITKALLGTSPITSITYVLSLFTPLTLGQWTIILNILFVVLEPLLMTRKQIRNDLRIYLLQIPITFCFGLFIDVSMNILYWLEPHAYLNQLISLLTGCFILAAGIALELKANIAMVAGEYFVKVMSMKIKGDFGYVKLSFDTTLVVLSCLVSYIAMSGIYGVREGTVLAAILVGPIVHFISPYYSFLDGWIRDNRRDEGQMRVRAGNIVITIAREYGSGGHLLGEMLSTKLGLRLYDKDFIHLAAQKSGIDETYILKNEQSIPSYLLKCVLSPNYGESLERSLSSDDVLFVSESKIIREIANKESCIIIGRCADYILKDEANVIKVFCYSDFESALVRCVSEYGMSEDEAAAAIKRTNHDRISHYEFYTGEKWGDPYNYNLMINTGSIGLEVACQLVEGLYENKQNKKD